jgi:hypothetical protein
MRHSRVTRRKAKSRLLIVLHSIVASSQNPYQTRFLL